MKFKDIISKLNLKALLFALIGTLLGIPAANVAVDAISTETAPNYLTDTDLSELAAKPGKVCKWTFRIEDTNVFLSHVVQLHQAGAAAPCGCEAVIPQWLPTFTTYVTTDNPRLTRDQILASVKAPKGFLVGQWNDPKIYLIGRTICEEPSDTPKFPADEK
jgi:hypothetical protein